MNRVRGGRPSIFPRARDGNPSDASGCLINGRNGLVAVYARIVTAANTTPVWKDYVVRVPRTRGVEPDS
jgi:hypothetical protein